MRVLFVVPSPDANPGDEVIFSGISRLIDESIVVASKGYFYLEAQTPDVIEGNRKLLLDDFDLLIVCGTPWLWDNCVPSRKYEELGRLLKRYAGSRKIALGIGACVPFHHGKDLVFADEHAATALRDIWQQFDLITTRDDIAADILTACGVPSHHEFCPSVLGFRFCQDRSRSRPKSRRGALIFYLPQFGISRESLPDDFIDDYVKMQLTIAAAKNLELACLLDSEAEYLAYRLKIALGSIPLLGNADAIYRFVADKPLVVTGRVHVAIPALMAGCRACLLPVDSRYRTAAELGVRILWRYRSHFPVMRIRPVPMRSLWREVRVSDFVGPVGMPMWAARPGLSEYLHRMTGLIRAAIATAPDSLAEQAMPAK